jgi:hypothetical protein
MKRLYYISDSLDELSKVQRELTQNGITQPQIHVLSWDDAEVARRELNEVEAVLKKDVVNSMNRGALVGVAASLAVLLFGYVTGFTDSALGWMPIIFLSIVVLGFCTWIGGFYGIQEPHHQFKRFQQDLENGRHVFFVDLYPEQETVMNDLVGRTQGLRHAGDDASVPSWVVQFQNRWRNFVEVMP